MQISTILANNYLVYNSNGYLPILIFVGVNSFACNINTISLHVKIILDEQNKMSVTPHGINGI